MVLIRQGRLVWEFYTGGATASDTWEIASPALTTTLAGMATGKNWAQVFEGEISTLIPLYLDAVNVPRHDPIKLKHLLAGTAGWKTSDLPGAEWDYEEEAFHAAEVAVAKLLGTSPARLPARICQDLAGPLGAKSWTCAPGAKAGSETPSGSTHTYSVGSNLRDLARLGYLWLRKGRWRQRQILDAALVTAATRDQTLPEDSRYGYGWFVRDVKGFALKTPTKAYLHVTQGGKDSSSTVTVVVPGLDLVAVAAADYRKLDYYEDVDLPPPPNAGFWFFEILKLLNIS